jgi:hypothetical protein
MPDQDHEEMVLTDEETYELVSETWRQLKVDPQAAWRFLSEAGWLGTDADSTYPVGK